MECGNRVVDGDCPGREIYLLSRHLGVICEDLYIQFYVSVRNVLRDHGTIIP